MSRSGSTCRVGSVLGRAILWSPVVLMPFAVLFCEAWLHIRLLSRGYEANTLRRETRELAAAINTLRARKANLETASRADAEALALNLVKPELNQIEILYARTGSPSPDGPAPRTIARLAPDAPMAVVPGRFP